MIHHAPDGGAPASARRQYQSPQAAKAKDSPVVAAPVNEKNGRSRRWLSQKFQRLFSDAVCRGFRSRVLFFFVRRFVGVADRMALNFPSAPCGDAAGRDARRPSARVAAGRPGELGFRGDVKRSLPTVKVMALVSSVPPLPAKMSRAAFLASWPARWRPGRWWVVRARWRARRRYHAANKPEPSFRKLLLSFELEVDFNFQRKRRGR